MGKKIVMIHTSFVSKDALAALVSEILPDVELSHIVDDSLLAEVKDNEGVTPGVQARMNAYVMQAASIKPDLIFNQCSSVGEAFDNAVKQIGGIKTLKVDQPMAQKCAELCPDGGKIAVVATVASTVAPSVRLVETEVAKTGKNIEVKSYLVRGALEILMAPDGQKKHNDLVMAEIEKAAAECDVIDLCQGSMTVLEPLLGGIDKPVLTSPRLAVLRVKEML